MIQGGIRGTSNRTGLETGATRSATRSAIWSAAARGGAEFGFVSADDGGGSAADFDLVVRGADQFAQRAHGVGLEDGVANTGRILDECEAGVQGGSDFGAEEPGESFGGGDFGGSAESGKVETRRFEHLIDEDAEAVGIGL
jgi:hypothetical protein